MKKRGLIKLFNLETSARGTPDLMDFDFNVQDIQLNYSQFTLGLDLQLKQLLGQSDSSELKLFSFSDNPDFPELSVDFSK
uniref:Uncharacterized protein n=1 Tax=Megaselia scalaris TaxID=36166 RepID=T1GC40_MEGSC